MTGYETQSARRQIQASRPTELQVVRTEEPMDEWWSWRGHKIHLDRYENADAPLKIILFHGVGTSGRQMSIILGQPLFKSGYETVALDMPGYGMTKVKPGSIVTYFDWVRLANDFINSELARDDRPVVLYGLSAGGMLTYHAAALNRKVKGIVGMIFLDQRNPAQSMKLFLQANEPLRCSSNPFPCKDLFGALSDANAPGRENERPFE